jgi:putative heme-binding domain-containing protein
VEPVWALASKNAATLHDLVEAVPLLADPQARYALYDRLAALLEGLPPSLASHGSGLPGRYVRVELPGRGTLTLAEVEVYSGGQNVARQGRATQKNTAHGGDASRAIDGNTSGRFADGGQTHTEENTARPYWELDLGRELPLERIVIYNRTDGNLGQRLEGFSLRVLDAQRGERLVLEGLPAPQPRSEWDVSTYGPAAEIRRAAMMALTSIRGKEPEVFRLLAQEIRSGHDRPAAIAALGRLPRRYWAADEAPGLLAVLIEGLQQTPVSERTQPPALAAMELADALISFLPVEEARQRRKTLRELGVRVIRLGTLFEKMSFDKDLLVVQAGRPVEFVLENSDLMPHNFVIVRPGTLEEIGLASEAQAQDPRFAVRQYVPQSPHVLAASRLLQPRQTQRVPFVAPAEAGVYPYVCTYPGHWRRMYGALYVVEDLEAYEADPQGYLAAHPLPIRDELLKDRRPRTEWQWEDLAADLERLKAGGRSYASARQMFTVASCVSCHRLAGAGNAFGPDLAQLDPKFEPADILRELLDPSARINEKFQTQIFQLASGQVISGLVLEETPDVIKLVENPLVKAMPIEIPRSEVLERKKSPTSLMPKGLLDKLSRDEVLDLIALVYARGKPDHPVFAQGPMAAGAHHHAH